MLFYRRDDGMYVITRNEAVGFGISKKEAEQDLMINLAKSGNATTLLIDKRWQQLRPWHPTKYILHLSDVGALLYIPAEFALMNTKTNKKVGLSNRSIYYYVSSLYGAALSYLDVTVVLRKEIDEFFTSITSGFLKISNHPVIKLANSETGFEPFVTYSLAMGGLVGISNENEIGFKYVGENYFYVTDFTPFQDCTSALAYILHRTPDFILIDDKIERK